MSDEQSSVSAESVYVAGWRGMCAIPSREVDVHLAAHLPNNKSSIMSHLASRMPNLLCLEQFPRSNVWPAHFECFPPTEFSVDLVFFSEGSDDEKVLDKLLNEAICSDFALKADIGWAEVLIFTSLQLPEKLHKSQGKFYFWGLFMDHINAFLPKSVTVAHVGKKELEPKISSNAGDQKIFEQEVSGKHIHSCISGEKTEICVKETPEEKFEDAMKTCEDEKAPQSNNTLQKEVSFGKMNNANLKKALLESIEEKSVEFQKVQSELFSLKRHLALVS